MKRLHPALVLLLVAIIAYGLLAPQLGFYWDDLPMSWIRYELGPGAMTQYFSTNRPVWGLLYQITTRLIPQVPVYWQIFALIWRWLGAVAVWAIVRDLWKEKPRFALSVALLFSALNLWMMEYFFPLEFARIGFIWTLLRDEYPDPRQRIKPSLKLWTPY